MQRKKSLGTIRIPQDAFVRVHPNMFSFITVISNDMNKELNNHCGAEWGVTPCLPMPWRSAGVDASGSVASVRLSCVPGGLEERGAEVLCPQSPSVHCPSSAQVDRDEGKESARTLKNNVYSPLRKIQYSKCVLKSSNNLPLYLIYIISFGN